MIDWQELLRCWSVELMGSELANRVDPPPTTSDWLGYASATDAEIAALEAKLGLLLPPSYKAFLKTSNGWRRTTPFIGSVRVASEVDWFSVENQNWIDAYSDDGGTVPDRKHFDYSDGSGHFHRAADLPHLVQISDEDDGVYLLNPRAVTPDGEWEAWFFANWVPGAQRYPSFSHLMVAEFQSFRRLQRIAGDGWVPPSLPMPISSMKRRSAKKVPKAKAAKMPPLTVDELLPLLESTEVAVRRRAVRTLVGRLGGRGAWAEPRPDLVEPVSALFYRSDDPDVRSLCVSLLTEVAPDGPGPPPLLASLSDPHPGVVLSGIFALHYFPDLRAVNPLCRFIESGVNPLFNENAMSALADLGDPAAVPTLVGVMTNTANQFDQSFGTAGIALGRIASGSAIDALIASADHADPRVRFAATVGLDLSGDGRAAAVLVRLAEDADPNVSGRARVRMGKMDF